jgi:polygalacturonase
MNLVIRKVFVMCRNVILTAFVLLFLNNTVTLGSVKKTYNILDFGAKPDGKTLCTQMIQDAIDQCAENGGGTVHFPAGTWLTGTIYLESHITLLLDPGCLLLGSKEKKDYGSPREPLGTEGETFSYWAIIAGKNLKDIAIRGLGTIDGQGVNFKYKDGPRPKNIYLEGCSDVLIETVRMRDAGSWMQHYRQCDRLTIRGITVFNHVSYNNDGLNIDSCRDVTITGCVVDSDDDAIVMKSLSLDPCENITISDCVVSSHCNSIKMGTESGGGFQNINVTNCTICSPRYSKVIYGRQRGLAGVALEIVDGGTLNRVVISNLTIRGVTVPIFMRLGNRARLYEKDQVKPDVGKFQNVIISNIIATDCSPIGCSITGLPDHPIENVSLADIHLAFEGGGTKEEASREIPEKAESYPESTMFGTLPAYGFFCRHVNGLRFHNLRFETSAPDYRHAVVFDDVDEAVIDSVDAPFASNAAGMIRCTNSRNILIRNCQPPGGTELFIDLRGYQTKDILLLSNDLSRVKEIANLAADVPESALVLQANQLPEK